MVTRRLGIIWDNRFSKVDFGRNHPVKSNRAQKTYLLLKEVGLIGEEVEVCEAQPVSEADLLLVHDLAYIKKVKKMSETGIGELSKDTPAFRGMHDYASVCVGGTLAGAKLAVEKFHPFFSLVGGYHHAFPNSGGGFNIYNDLAITAKWFLNQEKIQKIAIVDTDVHHGNGTQSIFYQNPQVLTISFHETGKSLYPGTGEVSEIGEKDGKGYCINFPFEPGSASSDVELVWGFRKIVPKALRRFKPDLVIWQAGVDGHIDDPLANLRFTTQGFQEITKRFLEVVDEVVQGKLITVAGGGYALDSTYWCTASIIAILTGKVIEIPEDVDQYRYAPPNAVPRPYVFEQLRYLEKNIPILQ